MAAGTGRCCRRSRAGDQKRPTEDLVSFSLQGSHTALQTSGTLLCVNHLTSLLEGARSACLVVLKAHGCRYETPISLSRLPKSPELRKPDAAAVLTEGNAARKPRKEKRGMTCSCWKVQIASMAARALLTGLAGRASPLLSWAKALLVIFRFCPVQA